MDGRRHQVDVIQRVRSPAVPPQRVVVVLSRRQKLQKTKVIIAVGLQRGTHARDAATGNEAPLLRAGGGGAHADGGRSIYLVVLLYNERAFLREHLQQRGEETQLLFHAAFQRT